MGRRSVKENKNIYQECREDLGLTREAASELLEFISDDRIEKIESGRSAPRPEEIMKMAECYKRPELTNYFCTHECPIGRKHVPVVESKELSQITLQMLATLNSLDREKNRLIEITVDGEISEDEKADFENIRRQLAELEKAISSLTLWVSNAANNGKIA